MFNNELIHSLEQRFLKYVSRVPQRNIHAKLGTLSTLAPELNRIYRLKTRYIKVNKSKI